MMTQHIECTTLLLKYIITLNQQSLGELIDYLNRNPLPERYEELFLIAAEQAQLTRVQVALIAPAVPGLNQHFVQQTQDFAKQVPNHHQTRKSGICAVMRVHNEAEYIRASILSIYSLVDEIQITLHQCQDATATLIKNLQDEGLNKIKVFTFNEPIIPVGDNYLQRGAAQPDIIGVAKFYNLCFARCEHQYALKWDGDMIALPTCGAFFRQVLTQQAKVGYFSGYDLFNEPLSAGTEPRLFQFSENTLYYDGYRCENLYTPYSNSAEILHASEKLYLHMKYAKHHHYKAYLLEHKNN